MAFQQELIKTVAAVALAATHCLGAPLLPKATTVALLAIQAFSLMHVLLTPSGKGLDKEGASASLSSKWLVSTRPSTAALVRYASCLLMAIVFARGLRSLGLSSSLPQVLALACLGGAICQACMMMAGSRAGSAVESCIHDPTFWPVLKIAEEHDELKASPLSSLAEEYYSPNSMLSASSFLDVED